MTESITVLGHQLRLLHGTNRKHYVTFGESFPYLYAWAPGTMGIWEIGITLHGHKDCQGRGHTLEEAEKDFVSNLEKYSNKAQKQLSTLDNLIAASHKSDLTPGPAEVDVNGVVFVKDETKTVQTSDCLIEVYSNSFNFSLERTHYLRPDEGILWRAAHGKGENRVNGREFLTPEGAIDCTLSRIQESIDAVAATLAHLHSQTMDNQERMTELHRIFKDLSYVSKHD